MFDVVVRQQKLRSFIERVNAEASRVPLLSSDIAQTALFWAHLALGEKRAARELLDRRFPAKQVTDVTAGILLTGMVESQYRDLFEDYAARLESEHPGAALHVPRLRLRDAIEHREFDAAARLLRTLEGTRMNAATRVFKVMLETLGVVNGNRKELKAMVDASLAGPLRDLAYMFLGRKKPVPGKLWPHPGYMPQWRLWLALWLEARGRKAAAQAIVKPARDPRYGPTNSQAAIEALLKR